VETYGELAVHLMNQLMKLNPSSLSSEGITNNMLLNGSVLPSPGLKSSGYFPQFARNAWKEFVDRTVSKETFERGAQQRPRTFRAHLGGGSS
jgi:hypothetical protein